MSNEDAISKALVAIDAALQDIIRAGDLYKSGKIDLEEANALTLAGMELLRVRRQEYVTATRLN